MVQVLVPVEAQPPRTNRGAASSYQFRRSLLVPIEAQPPRTNRGAASSYQSRRSLLVPIEAQPPRTNSGAASSYQSRRSLLVPIEAQPPRTFFSALLLALCCAAAIASATQSPGALRAEGRRLVTADGTAFEWRGVTAFRLLDHLADDRAREADAYLDWARAGGFTVVRVLTRLDGWADLAATDGQRLLPDLLKRAAARGLYVEAVATVGSGSTPYDWRAHARRVAEICAAHRNCLFEFANEPGHPSQADELHDMAQVDRFAAEAIRGLSGLLWTAGPSWDHHADGVPSGAYVVRHLERAGPPLDQIARLRELADLSAKLGRFVVSDEPTGADEQDGARTGRQRWNRPEVFFAMGALCRGFAIGCTFHLQDGLATVVPGPVQQECARQFVAGWKSVPATDGTFQAAGDAASPLSKVSDEVVAAFAFGRQDPVIVVLHESARLRASALTWKAGWSAGKAVASPPHTTIQHASRR